VSANDLTADLYFLSALRAGADRSRTRLLPLADWKEPLAPHDRFAQRMLLALQSLGYIEPELSRSWAEDWLDSRNWLSHGFENLSWRILRSPPPTHVLTAWTHEPLTAAAALETWAGLWQDLALAEISEYSRCSLEQTGFNPNWAYESIDALRAGIEKFSVNQVMYLVYITLRSLALEQRRATARVSKVGHLFSSTLRSYVQRAWAEGWAIRGFARSSELPRSAIAVLFAETATGLGERYYTESPSLEALTRLATNDMHVIDVPAHG
jgi:hypothetical protein